MYLQVNGTYFKIMKHLLLTTIAAVLLVGCGPSTPDIDIHQAATDGNIKAVKQHLAAGKDVNAPDRHGWTPLHYAALKGGEEIIELLIAKGANVNAKSVHGTPLVGHTPLDFAIKLKRTEIVDLIRKHGGKSGAADSIYVASTMGNIEAVKQHLAAGVDVNAIDLNGRTPLDFASPETADFLRKHGGKTGEELKAEGK